MLRKQKDYGWEAGNKGLTNLSILIGKTVKLNALVYGLVMKIPQMKFFVLTLNKEAQQGKLILSFDVLGLEIASSLENEKTVFANQNTLYAFIIFFNFSFLDKICKRNNSHEFSNEKVPCKLTRS